MGGATGVLPLRAGVSIYVLLFWLAIVSAQYMQNIKVESFSVGGWELKQCITEKIDCNYLLGHDIWIRQIDDRQIDDSTSSTFPKRKPGCPGLIFTEATEVSTCDHVTPLWSDCLPCGAVSLSVSLEIPYKVHLDNTQVGSYCVLLCTSKPRRAARVLGKP